MGKIKYDWDAIESEYVTQNVSQRDLCKKYGMKPSLIGRYAVDNKWASKRKKHKGNVLAKTIKKIETQEVNKLAKIHGIADNLTEIIDQASKNVKKMQEKGLTNAASINDLTRATKSLVAILRDIYEIPTLGEREAREMAIERLLLERERSSQFTSDESGKGVVMMPTVLDAEEEDND